MIGRSPLDETSDLLSRNVDRRVYNGCYSRKLPPKLYDSTDPISYRNESYKVQFYVGTILDVPWTTLHLALNETLIVSLTRTWSPMKISLTFVKQE